ncbi:MAG: hypothetical protein ACYC99_13845 [Candidatus Geothermincolia bacterium]
MKSWKKSPLIVVALVLLVAIGLLSLKLGASAQDANNNSGIAGLQGPEFTFGLFLAAASGNNPDASASGSNVFNGAPFALSGYVLNIYNGSVHIWISQCSQVVKDLGFKPGDVVTIFCAQSQIKDLRTGDFAEFFGFTVRGYLVRSDDTVLPAPFSY